MSMVSKTDKEKLLVSLQTYAGKKHFCDIEALLKSEDYVQHYTITVNAMSLLEYSIEFAHFLFSKPEFALNMLSEAFCKAALDVCNGHNYKEKLNMKDNIHIRLTALPACPEIYRTVLPRCNDVGQFLCISGTIVRATVTKMLEYRKKWKCSKCKYEFTVDVEVEQGFDVVKPVKCNNSDYCPSKNFTLVSNGIKPAWCKDYQEVRVQEQVHNLVVGTVPRSMWVILTDDLVDTCQPGNDVIISGVLHTRWQPLVRGVRSDIELVLVAHNIEIKDSNITLGAVSENFLREFRLFWQAHCSNPLQGRDFILSCLCPQVFGLYIVKLAVALVLAGGVQRTDSNGKIRGDSHLLLVGDPGTGKSQFLKYASKISRRSVLTSGVGTTNAGLTAAAVKDGVKWQLEAGALVLADGGICCIDEFSSIKEQDKASIHEAMEQQTVSVAKAGLVCKLSTQCSILAATNPKGKYNKNESLCVNTAMASPLLSRFDIILVLLDNYCASWDELVSAYILEGKDIMSTNKEFCAWSMEKMRAYFSAIKNLNPRLTCDSDKILQAYYRKQRSFVDRNAARTTPRLLQSLLRLAQGHARLMFRDKVLAVDAIMAIIVMESSMVGCGLFSDNDALHTTFPDDPTTHYLKQGRALLTMLDLEDILEKELSSLSQSQDSAITDILSQVVPSLQQGDSLTTSANRKREKMEEWKPAEECPETDQNYSQNSNILQSTVCRLPPITSEIHSFNSSLKETSLRNNTLFELDGKLTTSGCSSSKYFTQQNTLLATNHGKYGMNLKNKRSCNNSENVLKKKVKTIRNANERFNTSNSFCSLNKLNNDSSHGITDLEHFASTTNCYSGVIGKQANTLNTSSSTVIPNGRLEHQNSNCNSLKQSKPINRKRNAGNGTAQCLSNNASTISELNAIFSTELLHDDIGETSNGSSDTSFNFETLKKFAFKSKHNSQEGKLGDSNFSQSQLTFQNYISKKAVSK